MNARLLTIALFFISATSALAQEGWNWPEDEEMLKQSKEKQAFYKVSMGLENWEDANSALQWLYANNPDLNPSIYIDGVKVMTKIRASESDATRIGSLQDSTLALFDMRAEYFGNPAKVMDRKAYEAFKMHYKNPAKYSLLDSIYSDAYALNGDKISTFNLTPYITLAKYYHASSPEVMTSERVLTIHDQITSIIDLKRAQPSANLTKLTKEQDKVDALLSSMKDVISCEAIADEWVPKMRANTEDLAMAKKVFSYSLQAKCASEDYFVEAATILYQNDPTYQLANLLANKYEGQDDLMEAANYFQSALDLASSDEDKYENLMDLARIKSKQGQYPESRSMAQEAIKIRAGDKDAYNHIGNLYFKSYETCKGGKSRSADRAVFIAAYDMYKKAGNTEQMNASKAQFPSVETVFAEGHESGEAIQVNCWINVSVKLATRD